ncbi:MAG: FAD:protein FMN transferase [Melioribacteraceae bacterium]
MNSDFSKLENLHKFTHNAMATVFEFFIQSDDPAYSGEAAWAAFREIDRLEDELSRFRPNSEISNINRLKPGEKLVITVDSFECIRQALELNVITASAFDITYSDLINTPDLPGLILDKDEMSIIRLDERTVLDLGGIGKGFAIDKASEILNEWEIKTALIHGGFSSVKAIGKPAGSDGWPLSISDPIDSLKIILNFQLSNCSISGSGIRKGAHIIDPRTGQPALSKSGAWAFAASAAFAEGLSTAFMILDNERIKKICTEIEGIYGIILDGNYPETKKIISAGDASVIKMIV